MAEQIKVNIPKEVCLTTIRTENSRLLFVNNKKLENEVLAYLAKYQEVYGVVIYAFILMGNHYHMVAQFPKGNRHRFKKAFNRIFSNILKRHVKCYKGGHVWGRRYRPQALPRPQDIEHWFFYTSLNPISSGLVTSIYDYNGFNSFLWALTGETKTYKFVDWEKYNNLKRYNKKLTIEDCTEFYELKFSRLPGYEDMSQEDYKEHLLGEYKKRKADIIKQRKEAKKGFMGKEKLKNVSCGSYPIHTKTSERNTPRPLVLTKCDETRATYLTNYFSVCSEHNAASKKYRCGCHKTVFPPGTFKPTINLDHGAVLA